MTCVVNPDDDIESLGTVEWPKPLLSFSMPGLFAAAFGPNGDKKTREAIPLLVAMRIVALELDGSTNTR